MAHTRIRKFNTRTLIQNRTSTTIFVRRLSQKVVKRSICAANARKT